MEIASLRKANNQLEKDILNYVSNRVMNFKEETGFSPYRIDISVIESRSVGDHCWEFEIIPVKCEVGIKIF